MKPNRKVRLAIKWIRYWMLMLPGAQLFRRVEVDWQGFKVLVHKRDIGSVATGLRSNKSYQPELVQFYRKNIRPGMTVIDVGANIGLSTLILSELVGPTGKVYSFEPDPENYRILCENLRRNGISNAEVFNLALSNEDGEIDFFVDKKLHGLHSIGEGNVTSGFKKIVVKSIVLDKFLQDRGITNIDFVKVDTQGAEFRVASGAQSMLQKFRPRMILEFWPEGMRSVKDSPECLLELLNQHYSNFYILQKKKVSDRMSFETLKNTIEQKGLKKWQSVDLVLD